ncbi:MAG: hypothetical protein AAGI66_10125, partial [Cyanobacteria bacterium P01_H01_bin.74]
SPRKRGVSPRLTPPKKRNINRLSYLDCGCGWLRQSSLAKSVFGVLAPPVYTPKSESLMI